MKLVEILTNLNTEEQFSIISFKIESSYSLQISTYAFAYIQ